MIPATLDGWNLESIGTLLRSGVNEDERFDWKVMVPPAADEPGKLRVKDALAAFANGDGGFLIFGVKDDARLDVEARLVGVEKPDVELGRLNEYANACDPPVRWLPKVPPIDTASGRMLLVVYVPRSDRRPHRVVDRDRSSLPLRAQGGTRQMTMLELRAQFADQARRRRVLSFALSEVERIGKHANGINLCVRAEGRDMVERAMDWWMTRYDPDALVSVLPDLVELVDAVTLEQVNVLVRDARASDRIAAEFVAVRRRFQFTNMVPGNDGPKILLGDNANRIWTAHRIATEQLRKLLA